MEDDRGIIHNDIDHSKGRHSRESENPGVVPAKAGNQYFGNTDWIPPHQVRGKLSQARNDK